MSLRGEGPGLCGDVGHSHDIVIARWNRCLASVRCRIFGAVSLCCRNGVIDREELRALLESTDSGSEYAMTVRTLSISVALRVT